MKATNRTIQSSSSEQSPAAVAGQSSPSPCDPAPGERGAVLVEFSMVVGIFLMMSIGFVDVMRLGYMSFALQRAVTDAAHWGAVGTSLPSMSREDSIKVRFSEFAAGMGVDVDTTNLRICPLLDPNCTTNNAAGPNQYFIVRYDHPTMLFALPMSMTLASGTAARNEPFV